jgi:hypothetical protein
MSRFLENASTIFFHNLFVLQYRKSHNFNHKIILSIMCLMLSTLPFIYAIYNQLIKINILCPSIFCPTDGLEDKLHGHTCDHTDVYIN